MELKWVKAAKEQKAKEGSNRTFMELKYKSIRDSLKSQLKF